MCVSVRLPHTGLVRPWEPWLRHSEPLFFCFFSLVVVVVLLIFWEDEVFLDRFDLFLVILCVCVCVCVMKRTVH